MLRDCDQSVQEPSEFDYEFDTEFGASFRSSALPDELSVSEQRTMIEVLEREVDDRPMSLEEAQEMLRQNAPGIPFRLWASQTGWVGLPEKHFGENVVQYEIQRIVGRQTWSGTDWETVVRNCLAEIFPPPADVAA